MSRVRATECDAGGILRSSGGTGGVLGAPQDRRSSSIAIRLSRVLSGVQTSPDPRKTNQFASDTVTAMQARHPNSDWLTCEPIDADSPDNGSVEAHAGGVVLRPLGDLNDAKKVKQFYRACETLLNQRVERVVLDLSGVDKVDTKLLAALVVLRRKATSEGLDLRVYTSPSVYEWLQVCRIDQLIDHSDAGNAGHSVIEGAA